MGQGRDKVGAAAASSHSSTSVSAGSTVLHDVLSKIRRGDLGALATLYDHTGPMIFSLLHVALPEPSDAEQATQRCYLWLWRAAPSLSSDRRCAVALLLSAVEHELAGPARIAAADPVVEADEGSGSSSGFGGGTGRSGGSGPQ